MFATNQFLLMINFTPILTIFFFSAEHHSLYATPLTVRRAALSRRITASSVMGSPTLQRKDFNPTHVHYDPKIITGRAMSGGKSKYKVKGTPLNDKKGLKGDLLIQYL